jgi:hypothetical protein
LRKYERFAYFLDLNTELSSINMLSEKEKLQKKLGDKNGSLAWLPKTT